MAVSTLKSLRKNIDEESKNTNQERLEWGCPLQDGANALISPFLFLFGYVKLSQILETKSIEICT